VCTACGWPAGSSESHVLLLVESMRRHPVRAALWGLAIASLCFFALLT
jgi:hypothetical protein